MITCDPADLAHMPGCRCCNPVQSEMWAMLAVLNVGLPEAVAAVLKADGEPARLVDDPFLSSELAVAALLSSAWDRLTAKARDAVLASLPDSSVAPDLDAVITAIQHAVNHFYGELDDVEISDLGHLLDDVIGDGADDAESELAQIADDPEAVPDPAARVDSRPADAPEDDPKNENDALEQADVADGTGLAGIPAVGVLWSSLLVIAGYAATHAMRHQIGPSLELAVQAYARSRDGAPLEAEALRQLVAARMAATPFWRIVANAVTSRAYHYAYLRRGQEGGANWYRIVAVRDRRTSAICRYMHGREFQVSAAVALMETVSSDPHPEAYRTQMPWLPAATITSLDATELEGRGFIAPPFHGNCRSTVQFFTR